MDGPKPLKIFIQDNGWAGCVVVCAYTEQEALELMKGHHIYDPSNKCIIAYNITPGFIHECWGDR